MRRLLLAAAFTPLAGCAAVITPPPHPEDPVTVYLADCGRHASLLLPDRDGKLIEWAYGQWEWYALQRDEWWRVPHALLIQESATLGRGEWVPYAPDEWRRWCWLEEVHPIRVARADVERLMEKLDAIHADHKAARRWNETYRLMFVSLKEDYWVFNHCNKAVVEWLETLGCKVSHTPLWASFRVRE
jgi:hypothetical protein